MAHNTFAIGEDEPAGAMALFEGPGVLAGKGGDVLRIGAALFADGEEGEAAFEGEEGRGAACARDGVVAEAGEIVGEQGVGCGDLTAEEADPGILGGAFHSADEEAATTGGSGAEQVEGADALFV